MHRDRLIAGIALGLVLSVSALGAQKQIKQSKLPPAVQKSVEEHSAGATVTGYTSDKVDGTMVYRMDLVAEGLTRGIVMDSEGNVLSVEQEVAWSELPADVQKNFSSVSSKGKLGAVSTVSESGAVVAYVAVLVVNGERHQVRVKPKAADLDPIPGTGASK
jgi:hypothetical protein